MANTPPEEHAAVIAELAARYPNVERVELPHGTTPAEAFRIALQPYLRRVFQEPVPPAAPTGGASP